ncbi:MAG: hypothetical protein IIY02_01175, partial [Firmicutes bacterium]|nr:hypothetical protein [Bacillota bacterium]
VSAYIYFFAGIIASVIFEWNPYIRDVALYSMAPFLLTICLFEIYYKYKSYKYKRNLPKNRNKTFWQYLRTRKK